jgi:hypothetical protein
MHDIEQRWEPLCTGELADRLRAVVFDLAAELNGSTFDVASLGGTCGAALLYSYLDRAFPDAGFAGAADAFVEAARQQLADEPMTEALFTGFTGIGWCVEHLGGGFRDGDCDDDPNHDIDDALLAALSRSPWPGAYDLIAGLAGMGLYALERLPRPSAVACLERVLARLAELAEPRDNGITWWSDPRFIGPQRAKYPNGFYNLGAAHGVPGVIGMLGRACAHPEVAAAARPLLDGAVSWLLSQRVTGERVPSFACIEGDRTYGRSGWCYGEPSVAAPLWLAARAVGNDEWERHAIEIAIAATARGMEESRVVDAGLCHGSAGLAHLFNRFHQASRDPRFAAAARAWFTRTLDLRKPGTGVAGFLFFSPDNGPERRWVGDRRFLTGATGVALAMLAAIVPIEPSWDRVLVCSIPPAERGHG